MQSEKLIQSLIEHVRQLINQAEKLRQQDEYTLTWRESDVSWNVLECIEHLNLYGDFYLPEIARRIKDSDTRPDAEFKSGFLGSYFAKSMLPKEKLNKMKTFKDKNPIHTHLEVSVIDRFLNQQFQLLDLLDRSRNVSLNKVKTGISITALINLKLGDTFQFFVNHMIRHFRQIERIQMEREAASKFTITALAVK